MTSSKICVEISTTKGNFTLELDGDRAPITTSNFLEYISRSFYDDTIFHRVIPGFVIQGGGFKEDMTQKETLAPIENESKNALKNMRGTISMARTNQPHSATSQFFINLSDNDFLNHTNDKQWGYAVFGRVTEGMDVIEAIASVPTRAHGMHDDVPVAPVKVLSTKVLSNPLSTPASFEEVAFERSAVG